MVSRIIIFCFFFFFFFFFLFVCFLSHAGRDIRQFVCLDIVIIKNFIKLFPMIKDLWRFLYFFFLHFILFYLLRRCTGQRKVAFGKRIG